MHKKMRFALVSAGLLFLLPLLAGIVKFPFLWLLGVYAVFVLNAVIGATRVKKPLASLAPILGIQAVMVVIFWLIGRFVNTVGFGERPIEFTPLWMAIFAAIAIAAIGTGLVASSPEPASAEDKAA
ncbi:hypothetical protein [Maritimibacter dapengensis]|uniref:SPW repeat-containing protein n=1 Tax=Maritimibacter dapengensis TaxID=2836868 RepID=A0ABS6T0T1_9RHOB|nr:hypothetical protein [Maritimibacter dapengensis]MBV7378833.1 hypothetical protein [Maritimibacter dapengensis]